MRLTDDLFRIPDLAVFAGGGPTDQVPTTPPLLVAEIVSPDDRWNDLLQKLEEYRIWGVEHIWMVEPELKRIHVYDNGSLTQVSRLELPQFAFAVTAADLFA